MLLTPPPSTPPPTAQEQLQFLHNIQRILREGTFVSTYKFALLHSLADLAVLHGDDTGNPLELSTRTIAQHITRLYWNHAAPFPHAAETPSILHQNSGKQAAIVREIAEIRASQHGTTFAHMRAHSPKWPALLRKVERTLKSQPLWKLQTLGKGASSEFLYKNIGKGSSITLLPHVTYCLRALYDLIIDLIHSAWLRHIRRINHSTLGQTVDLASFLFGTQRSSLNAYTDILRDLQDNTCFYCTKTLRKDTPHVDHFIPWSLYPVDLGHNFVLAHATCNSNKSDHIAALPHLERWSKRNSDHAHTLTTFFRSKNLPYSLPSSLSVARWAYQRTDRTQSRVWLHHKSNLVPLDPSWKSVL